MVLNQANINHFQNILQELKKNDLYRHLKTFDISKNGEYVDNKYKVYNFSSNDYLGLSKNIEIIKELKNKIQTQISQCSSRLISGNTSIIQKLEKKLAIHRETESSLVFPNGYMANLGVIGTVVDNETSIFSDELNHASIIDACKLTNGKINIFPHNDTSTLEGLVKKRDNYKKKIIITEGIFSMDGDFVDLKEISRIARENNCILIVDDSHGDFIIGEKNKNNFSGTPSFLDQSADVDIHISSLSKGLGCFGGYVASSKLICEFLVNKSRPFIYTSALPDFLCEAANLSLDIVKNGIYQKKLYENIDFFYKIIGEYNLFNLKKIEYSPIIPIIIGPERKTIDISKELLKCGYYVQAIRYPTVKKNSARLRISITSEYNKEHIQDLILNLVNIYKKK